MRGIGDEPDDIFRAVLNRERRVVGAHFGADPAGRCGVHADATRLERLGELARGGIERGFGNAVAGPAIGHVLDGAELAADVDDARRPSCFQQRHKCLGEKNRSERVGDERIAQIGGLGVENAALPDIENGGVIDEDVEGLVIILKLRMLASSAVSSCRNSTVSPSLANVATAFLPRSAERALRMTV